jgi:exodeoxyribonuclease X
MTLAPPADQAKIARLVDFETTGLPEDPAAAICEAARLDIDLGAPDFPILTGSAWSSLINPGIPIPPETMAVHHITDEDVAGAPDRLFAYQALAAGLAESDVYVAHNAKFEQHFYSKRPQRWVDTYKCALRAWPEAPSHSNQVLRYWLKLGVDRRLADPAHRALPDCFVTAEILRRLLSMRPLERLIEISGQPTILPRCTIGEHRGKPWADVPIGFLKWMADKDSMDADLKHNAKREIKRREKAA